MFTCKNLGVLSFQNTLVLENIEICKEALKELSVSNMPNLKALSVSFNGIGDAGVGAIQFFISGRAF